jgi:beta-galactosidase
MAVALGRWLRPEPDRWTDRPPSVTITTARNRAGDRLLFVSNWSWHRVTVPLPVAARDLLSGTDFEPGGNLHLDTWDVRVLVERPAEE